MGLAHSPRIVTNGLVFAYDSDNIKSYKGPAIQNMASTIVAVNQSATGMSFTSSTESVFIPGLGQVISPKLTGFNNYSVSNICCIQTYYYVIGNGTVPVSPSTTYTYSIVYKTTSGYTHPNFMYRYEYNGGTYVTEVGIHNDTNRIHLGDGWYWAWATFTTAATTNLLYLRGFYYNYLTTNDNIYVAKVLVKPGNFTALHPSRWPDVNTTRANTATVYDISGQNIQMTANSLTYTSNGSVAFNGSNNYIDTGNPTVAQLTTSISIDSWVNTSNTVGNGNIVNKNYNSGYRLRISSDNSILFLYVSPAGLVGCVTSSNIITNNIWNNIVVTGDITAGGKIYLNGNLVTSIGDSYNPTAATNENLLIGSAPSFGEYFSGRISSVKIYNRALTAAEVKQNYNALKGRFGL